MALPFVKKFDIRGQYTVEFTDKDAFYLGRSLLKSLSLKKVLVAWDTRPCSRSIAQNLLCAWEDAGLEIHYMDRVPIEYVTAATHTFDYDLSIMCTGSHHPVDWTGMLMHTTGGVSVEGELVETIIAHYDTVLSDPYIQNDISLDQYKNVVDDVEAVYTKRLQELIPVDLIKEFNVLVDIGDGSGGRLLGVLEKLIPQVKVTRIHDRGVYDSLSSHRADPSDPKNMQDLTTEMQEKKYYDVGFAFDSDADRMLAVSKTGEYLNGSLLGGAMLYVLTQILKENDTRFGYAVDCGPSLYNAFLSIRDGSHVEYSLAPVPVGRSLMRNALRKGMIDFGVESVGHFYAKDFFMTDSSIFPMMLILLWMSMDHSLTDLSKDFPDGQRVQSVDDLGTYLDRHPFYLYQDFANTFEHIRKFEIDGLRGEAFDAEGHMTSWFALRHSGYDKLEKYYFGSTILEDFKKLSKIFDTYLHKYHSTS